jgi:hypothetical protein
MVRSLFATREPRRTPPHTPRHSIGSEPTLAAAAAMDRGAQLAGNLVTDVALATHSSLPCSVMPEGSENR